MNKKYLLGDYQAVDPVKSAAVTDDKAQLEIKTATTVGQFNALAKMALFPIFTLACYLALMAFFKSRGGYRPVQLSGAGDKTSVAYPAAKVPAESSV